MLSKMYIFKNWGIIQTNGVGIIDNSYSGTNDGIHLTVGIITLD